MEVPLALKVREMTAQERQQIERTAHSRTEAARSVERARIVLYMSQGMRVPAVASLLNISEKTTELWLKRFNEKGLAGLDDKPRRIGMLISILSSGVAVGVTDPVGAQGSVCYQRCLDLTDEPLTVLC